MRGPSAADTSSRSPRPTSLRCHSPQTAAPITTPPPKNPQQRAPPTRPARAPRRPGCQAPAPPALIPETASRTAHTNPLPAKPEYRGTQTHRADLPQSAAPFSPNAERFLKKRTRSRFFPRQRHQRQHERHRKVRADRASARAGEAKSPHYGTRNLDANPSATVGELQLTLLSPPHRPRPPGCRTTCSSRRHEQIEPQHNDARPINPERRQRPQTSARVLRFRRVY